MVVKLFGRRVAGDIISQWFERESKLDKIMNSVEKRVLPSPLYIELAAGFSKPHMHSTMNECCFTPLHSETEMEIKTGVASHQSKLSSDTAEQSKNMLNCERSKKLPR